MTREDMVEFAKKYDEPEVVQALVGALADPSETVRVLACRSLAIIGDPLAVPGLLQVLEQESSDAVRREAIDALGRIKDPSSVDALVALVDASQADKVPLNAIWAYASSKIGIRYTAMPRKSIAAMLRTKRG